MLTAEYKQGNWKYISVVENGWRPGDRAVLVIDDPDANFYLRKEYTVELVAMEHSSRFWTDFFSDIPARYHSSLEDRSVFCVAVRNDDSPDRYTIQIDGLQQLVKHPIDGTMATLENTIINLNDGEHWTREQIADWLETLDNNPIIEKKEYKYV